MAEFIYNNGDKYVGEEENGFRNGFGKYTFSDGSFYEGEYIKDKMQGWGTFSWPNGDIYVGEWENDAENGQGTYTYGLESHFAGDKYQGSFKNGVKSGYGTYYWADGDIYEGYWENDQQNGQGTFTYNNGQVTSGEWKNGEQISVSDSPNYTNTEPKERLNYNKEKTLVIKQVVWDDNVGFEYGLPEDHFTISDLNDLGEQWDIWYFQRFLKSTFFAELDADAMPVARFWIYKNIEDAKTVKADDAFDGDDKSLPFAWNFYIPKKNEFEGFVNCQFDPGWNDMKEQFQVLNEKVIQYWGLDELIQNPPQEFQEYTPHELLDSLIKIYINLVNVKPNKWASEISEKDNIDINKHKKASFQWENFYKTEEMIALQVREQVFNFIFEYYSVENVDDLTKKQINEIIKFRDQELSEFSNLKSGFNELIGMWES